MPEIQSALSAAQISERLAQARATIDGRQDRDLGNGNDLLLADILLLSIEAKYPAAEPISDEPLVLEGPLVVGKS